MRSLKIGLESESTLLVDLSASDTGLLSLVFGEVGIHEVEALLVDFEVLVVLKVVNSVHSSSFFDIESVLVDTVVLLLVVLTNLENVL